MPNQDKSQTDANVSGALNEFKNDIETRYTGKTSGPTDDNLGDIQGIEMLKQQFPELKGINSHRLKYDLVKNTKGVGGYDSGILDVVSKKLFNQQINNNEKLRTALQEDKIKYTDTYNKFKNKFRENILKSSMSGETIKNSIVKRRMKLQEESQPVPNTFESRFNKYGEEAGVNPSLLKAMARQESNFDTKAVSPVGARGLMQIMPNTAKGEGVDPDSLFDPDVSIATSAKIIRDHLERYDGDLEKALTAYNAGQGNLRKAMRKAKEEGGTWKDYLPKPEETLPYIDNVKKYLREYSAGTDLPTEKYKKIIQNNKEKYQELGLLNENGKLTMEDAAFEQLLKSDEEVYQQVISDDYENFEDILDNEYNYLSTHTQNANIKAQAYSVYDNYGSEGLTNFMNILQHEYMNEGDTEDKALEKAYKWLENSGVRSHLSRFMGEGKDSLEFRPTQATLDLKSKVPKNLNKWTSTDYKFNPDTGEFKKKNEDQIIDSVLKEYGVYEHQPETEIKVGFLGNPDTWVYGKPISEMSEEERKQHRKEVFQSAKNHEESGFFHGSPYSYLVNKVSNDLQATGKLGSLFKTVQGNGQYMGENKWKVNLEEADFRTHLAIDALNENGQTSIYVYPGSNENEVILDMNRRKRSNEGINRRIEEKAYTRNVEYDKETGRWTKKFADPTMGVDGFGQWLYNGALATLVASGQAASKYMIDPVIQHSSRALKDIEDATGIQTIGDVAHYLDRASEDMERLNQFNFASSFFEENVSDLEALNNSSNWNTVPSTVTPLAQYIGTMMLTSKGLLKGTLGAMRGFNNFAKTSKTLSAVQAGKFLKGSKLQTKLARWQQALKDGKNWAVGGQYIYGDVAFEALQTDDTSISNAGTQFLDTAIRKYNESGEVPYDAGLIEAGIEQDIISDDPNYNARYKSLSGINKMGVNALGSLAVTSLFDNILVGGLKGAKDVGKATIQGSKARIPQILYKEGDVGYRALTREEGEIISKRFTKSEIDKGIREIPEGRNFLETVKQVQFRPDWRVFSKNLNNNLDQWAVGDLSKTVGDAVMKEVSTGTIKGLAQQYADGLNEFFGDDIRTILRDGVKHYDELLKGGNLKKQDVDRIVEENYNKLVTDIGDNIYDMTSPANGGRKLDLPFKLADAFENGSVRTRPVFDEDGKQFFDLATANRLAGQNPNRVVKKLSDGEYFVDEVNGNYWMADVANQIRKRGLDDTMDESINRQLNFDGIDTKARELSNEDADRVAFINDAWEGLYGQKVDLGNRVGFVRGLSKDKNKGFKVIGDDGKIYENVALKTGDEVPENVSKYVDEVSEQTQKEADLIYSEEGFAREVDEAIEKGKKVIDDQTLEAHRKKIEQHFDTYYRVQRLHNKKPKGQTMLYDTAHQNEYGFKQKVTDFFSEFRDTGRATYRMVENVARNFGLDDERTIDLVRTTKTGNQKRIIGKKNIGPIKEWDKGKAKESGVPKDVVVKRTNADGRELFFVSNKKTEATPSKFVLTEDGVKLHPDWDMVNKNATLSDEGDVQLFRMEEVNDEMWYTPAETGDEGVLLNIQNPKSLSQTKAPDSIDEALRRNIDGYRVKKDGQTYYKPISNEQVLDPESAINYEVREAPENIVTKTPTKEDILKNVAKADITFGKGITRPVAYSIIGQVAGLGIDEFITDDDDRTMTSILGIGGALLGIGPINRAVRTVGRSWTKGADSKEEMLYKMADMGGRFKNRIAEIDVLGLSPNLKESTPASRAEFADFLMKTYREGQALGKKARFNRITESSFSFLKRFIDIPELDKFRNVLTQVESVANRWKTDLTIRYNNLTGKKNGYAVMREDARSAIDNFLNNNNLDKWEGLDGQFKRLDDLSEQDYHRMLNRAMWRIQHTGAKLDEAGNLVYKEKPQVEMVYNNSRNPLKELDKALLQDENMNSLAQAMRDWTGEFKSQYMGELDKLRHKLVSTSGEPPLIRDSKARSLAEELFDSNKTVGQFKKGLSDEERLTWKKASRASRGGQSPFGQAINIKGKMDAWTEIEDYYPQMMSTKSMETAESRFISQKLRDFEQGNLGQDILGTGESAESLSRSTVRNRARDYFRNTKLPNDFWEANGQSIENTSVLKKFNNEGRRVERGTFPDKTKAEQEVIALIEEMNINLSARDRAELDKLKDNYIRKGTRYVDDGEGNQVEKEFYYIEEPKDLRQKYGLVEKHNRGVFGNLFDFVKYNSKVQTSGHFENPRNFVFPEYMVETNMDNIIHRLSVDAGTRLHFMKNGVYDAASLNREYLNPIREAVQKKIGGSKAADKAGEYITRLRNIYDQQAGINREIRSFNPDDPAGSAREASKHFKSKAKTARNIQNVKNLISAGYYYGIGGYDWFQHAISTPLLTSWESWGKSVKSLFGSKQTYERMRESAQTLHYADQKLKTFRPEQAGVSYRQTEAVGGRFSTMTDQAMEFSGNYSHTKALGKMMNFDIKDMGAWQMSVGGFNDVNKVATDINVKAFLHEAEKLAQLARKLDEIPEGQPKIVQGRVQKYTREDIYGGFENLGIARENVDDFLTKNQKINDVIEYVNKNEGRPFTLDDYEKNPEAFGYLQDIVNHAVDSYHGRAQILRAESWNTPYGKLAAQYSYYHNNFGLQVMQRRIRQPISRWNKKFGEEMDGDASLMKIFLNIQRGEKGIQNLKDMGLSNEAIESIPTDAMRTVGKLIPAAGLTWAMEVTLDAFDMIQGAVMDKGLALFGADEYDGMDMEAVNRHFSPNPMASEKSKLQFHEFITDPDLRKSQVMLMWGLGLAAKQGTFGKYGSLAFNQPRFGRGQQSVLGMTPFGRDVEDIYNIGSGIMRGLAHEGIPANAENVGKPLYDLISRKIPVLGSQTVGRDALQDAIFGPEEGTGEMLYQDPYGTFETEPFSVDDFDQ